MAHYCGHSRQKANSCDRNRNGKPHDFRTSGRGLGVCPLVGTVATWENPLPGNIPRFLRPSDHAACAVAYRVRFSRLLRERLALASSVDHHFSRGSVNCVHYRFRTAIGGRIETSRSTQIAPTTQTREYVCNGDWISNTTGTHYPEPLSARPDLLRARRMAAPGASGQRQVPRLIGRRSAVLLPRGDRFGFRGRCCEHFRLAMLGRQTRHSRGKDGFRSNTGRREAKGKEPRWTTATQILAALSASS